MELDKHPDVKLLTTPQTADVLGVTRQTLWNWRIKGIGPNYVRIGGERKAIVRYRMSELDRWINRQTVIPTPA